MLQPEVLLHGDCLDTGLCVLTLDMASKRKGWIHFERTSYVHNSEFAPQVVPKDSPSRVMPGTPSSPLMKLLRPFNKCTSVGWSIIKGGSHGECFMT